MDENDWPETMSCQISDFIGLHPKSSFLKSFMTELKPSLFWSDAIKLTNMVLSQYTGQSLNKPNITH